MGLQGGYVSRLSHNASQSQAQSLRSSDASYIMGLARRVMHNSLRMPSDASLSDAWCTHRKAVNASQLSHNNLKWCIIGLARRVLGITAPISYM